MSRIALILGGTGLAAVAMLILGLGGGSAPDIQTKAPDKGVERKAFVDGLDLGEDGNGYALILHPMATNGDMRVVTDPDALRAAQGKAFYTDDPDARTKVLVLSLLFLSPPGIPPDSQFVSVVQNKTVVEHFKCYPAFCNGIYRGDPPHARNLAGLLEASHPVERITESFRNPDNARAAHFRALKDPQIVQIDTPSLPPPNRAIYPNRVILSLPPILLETDETGQEPIEPFNEAEFTARFTAAFTHAYPDTEAYRLGEMRFSTSFPPESGWPVVSDQLDGYLRDDSNGPRGLKGFLMTEPVVAVELIPAMAETLQGPDPFHAMPAFAREPVGLSDQLDALAAQELGRPCLDCFKIELPATPADNIHVRPVDPVDYTLSYLRKMPQ
ncbi:hypothetical protein [Roseovarius sp. 2305UL8-3]|uniref:hypothetical protein n=1 Tax=Roseovarius conchicola TaxID=3121636 RepID=UPI003529C11A